jgi:hypothetical protein
MKKPSIEAFLGGHNGGVKYDALGTCILTTNQNRMILDMRGWGEIQHLFKTHEEAEAYQDEVGAFVAAAINEKLNRLSTTKNK